MIPVLRYLLMLLLIVLGITGVATGFFSRRFSFKPLDSREAGPTMPVWMAKPFFVALGCAFLYAAFGLARNAP